MKVVHTIKELRTEVKTFMRQGAVTGLVPTMGYLHQGHLSLVEASKAACDITMASIFVNPMQFDNPNDLRNYPKDTDRDIDLLEKAGADLVFIPTADEMYPLGEPLLKITMPRLTAQLCGKYRSGHFEGVLFVVLKLLQLFSPDKAFFGRKDYQQWIVIKQMAAELSVPAEIVGCPLIREEDGLAMSSRNVHLDEKARKHAVMIYRALKLIEKSYHEGKTDVGELKEIGWDVIETGSLNRVEYLEFVSADQLEPVTKVGPGTLVAVAAYTDGIRLIDNIEITGNQT